MRTRLFSSPKSLCWITLAAALFAAPPTAVYGDEPWPKGRALVDAFEKEAAEIRARAAGEISQKRRVLLAALQDLQESLTRDGRKDEAAAVRDEIARVKAEMVGVRPDPGNLEMYQDKVGQSFYFEVTGSADGSLYGTDVYTSDSALAKAAVHAGVIQVGKRGVVKVTMAPGTPSYKGTSRNGIDSNDWPSPWHGAYKVEAAKE